MDFIRQNRPRADSGAFRSSPPSHSMPGVLTLNQGNEIDQLRDPQWDAEALVQGRFRAYSNARTLPVPAPYDSGDPIEPDEHTLLLGRRVPTSKRLIVLWTSDLWRRICLFIIFPVAVVLAWCAVPLPAQPSTPDESFTNRLMSSTVGLFSSAADESAAELNFWFFLFFYFGIYNAIALLLITKIFDIYSLNWWPKWLGGATAYTAFWLFSQALGAMVYLFTGLEKYTLTWVFLTFITMSMPLLAAWSVLRSENRNTYRYSLTLMQKIFLERQLEYQYRMPDSFVRFLWFCAVLLIGMLALFAGEAYARVYVGLDHSRLDGPVYVYSWVATVYIFDTVTDWIIQNRVRSYPLSSVFKLYFFMIYFIFYRNLFLRLTDPWQFAAVQAASFIWVCTFYPLCMTEPVYRGLVYFAGVTKTYEQYQKQLGRSFYIRNMAENVTMLGFLCWVYILSFGPNRQVYKYFADKDGLIVYSCIIWATELASSVVIRVVFRRFFSHDIGNEAVKDFHRFPEMVPAMILVIINVLQDMLLATINLQFQGGYSNS